jgi:tricorn protease
MAPDIWLFQLESKESKRITDYEGTDTIPMWHGTKVYYLSDAGPEHRLNIWLYDTQSGERKQVTSFADYDCRWPSIGPGANGQGEIVLTNGPSLYLVDLASNQSKSVAIVVPGDRPKIRPRTINVSDAIVGMDLSPSAKRVAAEARGDIWTLPAKNGSPRNLTRTSGIAERDPAWSPDGRWIAYFSDATGEYELYAMQSDGNGEVRQLTSDGNCYRYNPVWSPDSKWIAFSDKTGSLYLHSLENKKTQLVDRDPSGGPIQAKWSHNSEWVTYSRSEEMRAPTSSIYVYNALNGNKHRLTSGFFRDGNPVFDRTGDHLFFTSSRSFNAPKYEDVGTSFIYSGTEVMVALPLRADVKNPFLAESDEESWKADDKKAEDKSEPKKEEAKADEPKKPDATGTPSADATKPAEDAKKPDESKKAAEAFKPLVIEVAGAESRSFQLPIKQGTFGNIAVNDKGQLIYVRTSDRGAEGSPSLQLFDLNDKKREEKKIADDRGNFTLSADGKKLLVRQGRATHIVDAAADQKLTDAVPLDGMDTTISPREEWANVFNEAWRVQRDFFYDPKMHGVDWPAIRKQYAAMLDDCVSRRDVSFLIAEMISELNVGHAYC